jgi:hypothetical protein
VARPAAPSRPVPSDTAETEITDRLDKILGGN